MWKLKTAATLASGRSPNARLINLCIALCAALIAGCNPLGADEAKDRTLIERAAASGGKLKSEDRVVVDLAGHPELAELKRGSVSEWPLGGLDSGKIGLGGFGNDISSEEIDGRTALITSSRAARLRIPLDEAGPVEMKLIAKAFARGSFRADLSGKSMNVSEEKREDGWSVLTLKSAHRFEGGEHELLIRTPPTAVVRGIGRASGAFSSLRVGTPGALDDAEAFSIGELLYREGGKPGLKLKPGVSIRYPLFVERGMRLRGTISGGSVSIRLIREGGRSERLVAAGVSGDFERSLEAAAGEIVYLELIGEAGEAKLLHPRVIQQKPVVKAPAKAPKNVVVILIDTLRADKLRPVNPKTRVRTPGLDRFAATATTFLRGHSSENWTKPSIASLFSGLTPWEHTATKGESVLPRSVPFLAEILKSEGFETASFIANGYVSDRFGFGRGWDFYRNYIRENRRSKSEFIARDVLSWLDSRKSEKPFFLYIHTIDPHVPYRPPEDFLGLYGDTNYRGQVNFRTNALFLEHVKMGKIKLNARDRAHLEALYDGEISYHDVNFTTILDALKKRGLDEDTLVIVTADHGEEFWDHGSVGHGHNVYQELLHIPYFIKHPGIERPGTSLEEAVSLTDLAPTILDALGKSVPEEMSGRSLIPLLKGESLGAQRFAVAGFMDNWRTITLGDHKLIARPRNRQMLFNLKRDPGEKDDVSSERGLTLRALKSVMGVELHRTAFGSSTPSGSSSARATSRRHSEGKADIDDELAEQLRSLGYVH